MSLADLVVELTAGGTFSGSFDSSELRRAVWSRDASHYRILPKGGARATCLRDVRDILASANARGVGVTFRSGGSSLSGQTLGDGLVVDVRSGFQRVLEITDNSIRVEPGVTISRVNGHLLRRGQKLGPDPASMIVSTIGGAVANNSSGMSCGTRYNSYATIVSATIVLADGTVVESASPSAEEHLTQARPNLVAGLLEIRDFLRASEALVAEIKRQFSLKNTMGYSLQAFLDYESPVDILLHLMVGSQGTLGFLGEIELRTLPILPHTATTLLVFDSLERASQSILEMTTLGASAIELLDAHSLAALESEGLLPESLARFVDGRSAAFLVDFEAKTPQDLEVLSDAFAKSFAGQVILPMATGDERAELWKARKSVYAVVAKNRPPRTTALLEDVVVPAERMVELCLQLSALCERHGYQKPVFFGHVRDGNLHFMISDDFSRRKAVTTLGDFTDEMVEIVLGLGGNLKAEHGAGRAMAPFVERQFGPDLFRVMRRVKDLLDPNGILNPGVIFSENPTSHLDNVKSVSEAHTVVDSCVECGFCESSCPSAGLTLSPRERIVALRERGYSALEKGVKPRAQERYEIDQTCAVDGMCAVNCPVGINTGSLVKELRGKSLGQRGSLLSRLVERNWAGVLALGRTGLKLASLAPRLSTWVTQVARAALRPATLPLYSPELPATGYSRRQLEKQFVREGTDMVFLPSCMNSLFGEPDLKDFLTLTRENGYPLQVPKGIEGFCCGTPFSSKGLREASSARADRTQSLLREQGTAVVVIDGSSCHQTLFGEGSPVLEVSQFIAEYLADVPVKRRLARIILHPTCSGEKSGANEAMKTLASSIADEVITPVDWKCCGYAGDRGMLVPELTKHATQAEAAELDGVEGVRVSNNQPCQIALTQASGEPYRSIVSAWLDAVR